MNVELQVLDQIFSPSKRYNRFPKAQNNHKTIQIEKQIQNGWIVFISKFFSSSTSCAVMKQRRIEALARDLHVQSKDVYK